MSDGTWRARLISNLSSWLVEEGPLEQVGCECCRELDCTTQNYKVCTRRLEAYERAMSNRHNDVPPQSTTRVKVAAASLGEPTASSGERNGTED